MRLLSLLLWSCAAGALVGSLTATAADEPVGPLAMTTVAFAAAAVALRRLRKAVGR